MRGLRQPEAGLEVDGERRVELRVAHCLDAGPWVDRGVVHDDVQRAEAAHGFGDRVIGLRVQPDVAAYRLGDAAASANPCGDRCAGLPVGGQHPRAGPREHCCDRGADAAPAARHQRDLAIGRERLHRLSRCAMRRWSNGSRRYPRPSTRRT